MGIKLSGSLDLTGSINNIKLNGGVSDTNWNIGIGNDCLINITSAKNNIAIGSSSLQTNSTGWNNIGLGEGSLFLNTGGNSNNAQGIYSLYENIDGDSNIALGAFSLGSNTRGNENIAIGENSLNTNSVGSRNIAIGRSAGGGLVSGSNNVIIGDAAAAQINGLSSGNVYIGGSAGPASGTTENNKLYIANASGTPLIGGDFSTKKVSIDGDLAITGSVLIKSGSIKMPDRPAFRVIGDGGQILAPYTISGSRTVVDYNQGNHWNNTTGLFTAPIAGLYQVNLVIRTQSNTNSTINQAIVYKSGSLTSGDVSQIMVEYAINTTMNHAGGSTISYLDAGDTLRAVVAVGTCSFDGNDNFSVAYIG